MSDESEFKSGMINPPMDESVFHAPPPPPPKAYHCRRHGNIGSDTINSTIKHYEGSWCMRCWLEHLDSLEIKVTEMPKPLEYRGPRIKT